jgi:hypothetical protein
VPSRNNLEGKKAYLEGGWRAVVGQGRMMEKTLSNATLSYLSTATWRVFGKSIYTEISKKPVHMHIKP